MSRSRTYRFYQRYRITTKRRAAFLRQDAGVRWGTGIWIDERVNRPLGYYENEQPHMGCRRAKCGLCKYWRYEGKARMNQRRDAINFDLEAIQ